MSDFAKDQLKKYGWTEGKGLGKNETGITKAINLVANQNKAGIGYDGNVPWWESLYDNTIKTIQIDKVSSPVVDTTPMTRSVCIQSNFSGNSSLGKLPMHWFIKSETLPKIEFTNARFRGFDQQAIRSDKTVHDKIKDELIFPSLGKLKRIEEQDREFLHKPLLNAPSAEGENDQQAICSDKMMHDIIKDKLILPSSGKLKRIEEQDRELLHKPLLNAPPARKNDMAYRSMNIESDMEEEHEIYNNESIPPSEEDKFFEFKSKSSKKKHRKRINKLLEQLNRCNLKNSVEEIDVSLDQGNIPSSNSYPIPIIVKKCDTDLIDFSCKELCSSCKGYKPCTNTRCFGNNKKHKTFLDRTLCQKMKKSNEKKPISCAINSQLMRNCSKKLLMNDINESNHKSFTMIGKSFRHKKMEHLKKKRDEYNAHLASQIKIMNDVKHGINEILFSPELEDIVGSGERIVDSTTGDLVTKNKQHSGLIDRVSLTWDPESRAGSLKLEKSSHYDTFCSKSQMLKLLFNESLKYDALKLNNKIQKKKDQHYRSKNMKRIVEKMKGEVLTQELNSVIKNLTTFNLTEEVNANTIKKRPTQTHLTPV